MFDVLAFLPKNVFDYLAQKARTPKTLYKLGLQQAPKNKTT